MGTEFKKERLTIGTCGFKHTIDIFGYKKLVIKDKMRNLKLDYFQKQKCVILFGTY